MAIINLFSKRQRALRGEVPDVYTYGKLPNELIVQIIHIWRDTLGDNTDYNHGMVRRAYQAIVESLCREYGLFKLSNSSSAFETDDPFRELANYFLQVDNLEKQLDIIELSFQFIDGATRDFAHRRRSEASECADDAINELNLRFKEHRIGYQYLEGEIIRIDSELIHSESVKPALQLLREKYYKGAQQEFLNAYDHYRHGRHKEALNECLKSFESTMKAICDKRRWPYQPTATAKTLIEICFNNGLVPSFWQAQFNSLRSLLESSIPTGRNKLSGHGQGSTPTVVPDYLVAYMLHMTASTLVFLTTSEKNL